MSKESVFGELECCARPIGMGGWRPSTSAGAITALGPWEPPRGRSNGQSSLLVRHRGSAQRRWVEAHQAWALGTFDRRYSVRVLIAVGMFFLLVSHRQ